MADDFLDVRIDSYVHKATKTEQLRNISFRLDAGKPHTLFGASGSGKSTLLGALLPEPEGVVTGKISYWVDGREMTSDEVCSAGLMGFMSQFPGLLPWQTIRQNFQVPTLLNPTRLQLPVENEMRNILDSVSLPKKVLDNFPHQLSFGMKQRAAFARALLYKPRFLLLDEVYTGLDVATVKVIEEFLVRYTAENNAVTLLVTHNLETGCRNAHGSFFLSHAGTLVALSPEISREELISLYVAELEFT